MENEVHGCEQYENVSLRSESRMRILFWDRIGEC